MDKAELLSRVRRVFPNATDAGPILDEEAIRRLECHDWTDGGSGAARTAGARAAGSAPSLDRWTHNRPYGTYTELHCYQFSDGMAEIYVTKRPPGYCPPRPGKKRKAGRKVKRSEMTPDDVKRCAQRAKKQVRWRCKLIGSDRILTLTSRRYMITVDLCWLAFREFNRLMRAKFGEDWAYVCVPELHPMHRDHFHMHLAVTGYYDVRILRDLWHRALWKVFPHAPIEEHPGNVDMGSPKPWYTVTKTARYISKYITKGAADGFMHAKRYESSRNIPTPKKTTVYMGTLATDYDIIRTALYLSGGRMTMNPRWITKAGFDCIWIETEPPD